jgi:hypothetical protein
VAACFSFGAGDFGCFNAGPAPAPAPAAAALGAGAAPFVFGDGGDAAAFVFVLAFALVLAFCAGLGAARRGAPGAAAAPILGARAGAGAGAGVAGATLSSAMSDPSMEGMGKWLGSGELWKLLLAQRSFGEAIATGGGGVARCTADAAGGAVGRSGRGQRDNTALERRENKKIRCE